MDIFTTVKTIEEGNGKAWAKKMKQLYNDYVVKMDIQATEELKEVKEEQHR